MGAKGDALLGDFAQGVQAENLEAARIGQDGPRPCHEAMQTGEMADSFDSWPQVKVISISQKNLHSEFFENILRHSFDSCSCAHGHEHGSFDLTMRRQQTACAGLAGLRLNVKLNGHLCSAIVATES